MQAIPARELTASCAWEALPIATLAASTTERLHWTDQAYRWHVNDGHEVLVVLDGVVHMHTRHSGQEQVHCLEVGNIFYVNLSRRLWHNRKVPHARCASSVKAAFDSRWQHH